MRSSTVAPSRCPLKAAPCHHELHCVVMLVIARECSKAISDWRMYVQAKRLQKTAARELHDAQQALEHAQASVSGVADRRTRLEVRTLPCQGSAPSALQWLMRSRSCTMCKNQRSMHRTL